MSQPQKIIGGSLILSLVIFMIWSVYQCIIFWRTKPDLLYNGLSDTEFAITLLMTIFIVVLISSYLIRQLSRWADLGPHPHS